MIRPALLIIHRWAGLLMAGFLFVSGLTGAMISWDHELDELLNGYLLEVKNKGEARPSLELANEIEARYPHAEVIYIPLVVETGRALAFDVAPRVNPGL